MRVEQGETIAIVGANGSGKTTLAKLLCGLLSPTGGEVIVDGLHVTHVEASGRRSMQTVVFQDFAKYDWTLAENVAPLGAADEQTVRVSLSQTGFPESVALDTPLGSGYPGARDLSGGQWQRVAVARTLQKVHEGAWLVMLDEPTAQMDIEGEVEVFQNITDATKECATILISHRFPTVRQAARIYVLANGEIAETGSHDDLMKRNGIYREMFDLQASGFRDDSE